MRHAYRHILIMLLIVAVSVLHHSCSYSSDTAQVLDMAESVMSEHPDSAYRMLSSLPSPVSGDRGQHARYALLRTESEYKSGMCPSEDSLIATAVV